MRKAINGCVLLLAMAVSSCKNTLSSAAEYVRYIKEDSGLNKTVTVGDVDYVFRLLPVELVALKAASGENGTVDRVKYSQRLSELEGHVFVNIEMQMHDRSSSVLKYHLKDEAEYEQRVMYYEFYAKDDLKLICNGSEMPTQSYQYENHLDLMPFNTIVAAFPLCKDSKDFQVVFNDRALNNLFLKANFKSEDINSIPKLNLQ